MEKEQSRDYIFTQSAEHRAHRVTEKVHGGEKIIVKCSACGEPLVEIWILRPNANVHTTLKAKCGMCDDYSFEQEVDGQYCLGNIEEGRVSMIDLPTNVEVIDGRIVQDVLVITEKTNE